MAEKALTSIPIPQWQIAQLQQLSGSGKLSGVSPTILALMDQAESSGEAQGAGVNSSGYGGYFGLGAGKQYPSGSVSRATLLQNSQQSFGAQAPVAAGEFASLLASHGGNAYAAEHAYQGGSSEGTNMFAAAGVPGAQSGYTTPTQASLTATTTANNSGSGGGLLGIDLNPADWLTQAFQPVIQGIETYFVSVGVVIVGLILVVVALGYFMLKGISNASNSDLAHGLEGGAEAVGSFVP